MHLNAISSLKTVSQQRNKSNIKQENKVSIPVSVPVSNYTSENVRANFFVPSFSSQKIDIAEFVKFLSDIDVNDEPILSQMTDFSFQSNPDFDYESWMDLISALTVSEAVYANGETESFLDILNKKEYVADLFNSKQFSPSKALNFLYEYSGNPDFDDWNIYPDMTLDFMMDFATSKNSSAEDYVNSISYLKNLKAKDGTSVFANDNGSIGERHFNAIKYLVKVDASSVEASNTQMLLDLVVDGVVDKHVFRDLPEEGAISKIVVDDIDKLYDAYISGVEPIDAFVPTFESASLAKKTLKVGDVYELANEKNIFILDKNSNPVQLKMDKPTYFKLFPPIERYATSQNQIGNCWELSAVNSLLADSEERISILSLFEQQGDDIIVQFPRSKNKTLFKGGNLPEDAKAPFYSFGAQGVRLIEYAHGKDVYAQKIFELYDALTNKIMGEQDPVKKAEYEEKRKQFDEILAQQKGLLYYSTSQDGASFTLMPWNESSAAESYDSPYSYSRNGGYAVDMYYDLAYDTKVEYLEQEEPRKKLKNPNFFKNNVLSYGTPCPLDGRERTVDGKFHLAHVYSILPGRVSSEGIVEDLRLIDPHSIVEVSVSHDDLKKYGGDLYIAHKAKNNGPSFKGIKEDKAGLMTFFNNSRVDDRKILDYVKDYSFADNPKFDSKGWKDLLKFFQNTKLFFGGNQQVVLLDELVKNPSFSAMLNSEEFKPEKAQAYFKRYLHNPELNQKFSLDENIELMNFFATSKYKLDDFLNAVTYFNNLKNPNGEKILGEHLNVMDFIDILKYLLSVNQNSVDASNVEMLLSLAEEGVVGPHLFAFLPEQGKMSEEVVQDIDKLYEAYCSGTEPIDAFVPTYKTIEEAQSQTKKGDVFEIDGRKNVYINLGDEESLQLMIPKTVYFDLFPPVERFATTQYKIANCWELTGFNALYSDVDTRADLLSLFSYDEKDKSVSVKFPTTKIGAVKFKNCVLPRSIERDYFSRGAKGIQMLEFVHGKEIYEERYQKLIAQLEREHKKVKSPKTEKRLKSVQRMYAADKENLVIDFDDVKKKWKYHRWDSQKDGFGNAQILTRNYGESSSLFNKLGYKTKTFGIKMAGFILPNPKIFDENIIKYGTGKKDFISQEEKALGIIPTHAYRLTPATVDEKGRISEFYLINPVGMMQTKISLKQLVEIGGSVTLVKKKL